MWWVVDARDLLLPPSPTSSSSLLFAVLSYSLFHFRTFVFLCKSIFMSTKCLRTKRVDIRLWLMVSAIYGTHKHIKQRGGDTNRYLSFFVHFLLHMQLPLHLPSLFRLLSCGSLLHSCQPRRGHLTPTRILGNWRLISQSNVLGAGGKQLY